MSIKQKVIEPNELDLKFNFNSRQQMAIVEICFLKFRKKKRNRKFLKRGAQALLEKLRYANFLILKLIF